MNHVYQTLETEVQSRLTTEWLSARILEIGLDQSTGIVEVYTLGQDGNASKSYYLLKIVDDAYVSYLVPNYTPGAM